MDKKSEKPALRTLLMGTILHGTAVILCGMWVIQLVLSPRFQLDLFWTLVVCSGLILAVMLGMGWILGYQVARPISNMIDTSNAKHQGGQVHFEGGVFREADNLADTLNYLVEMFDQVEELRRDTIANLSHDLRTPLTMIIGYAEAMRDLPEENTPENAQLILDEGKRLARVVQNDLGESARGVNVLHPEAFDLGIAAERMIRRYQRYASLQGVKLRWEGAYGLVVYADWATCSRALGNLLNNAVEHCGPDMTVLCRTRLVENGVCMEVEDHGDGIAPEAMNDVWERHISEHGVVGRGLGLSIVKSIAERQELGYTVESVPGCTVFRLTFPTANQPKKGEARAKHEEKMSF